MRSPTKTRKIGYLLTLVAAAFAMLALAGAPVRSQENDDGYGATYARIRFLEGQASIESTTQGQGVEATANMPLAPSDRILTGDGRVELELADGSVLWLDRDTQLYLRNLSDINNRYENSNLLALPQGTIRLEAVEPESKDKVFRIDTPHGSVYLLSGGSFRVDADDDRTSIASLRGVAELSGDEGSVLVRSGEMSFVDREGTPAGPRSFNTLRADDFDRYCESRQAAFTRKYGEGQGESAQPPPQDLPNEVQPYVRELSFYGGWHNVAPYGWVWRPTYYGAWSPYVNGYWAYYPTGWCWVSYDHWGWAPYHYGRWDFAVNIGWVWIPGRVWSGAWVSFAVGPSYIGWCPLNYWNVPVYNHVNITHVTNVNVTNLRGRGWRFVPVGRFGDRRGGRNVVAVDRLPRDSNFVISRRLPRFDPRDVSSAPDRGRRFVQTVRETRVPLPVVTGEGGRPTSFRKVEGPGRTVLRREQAVRPNQGARGRPESARPPQPQKQRVSPRATPGRSGDQPQSGKRPEPQGRPPGAQRPEVRPPRSEPQARPSDSGSKRPDPDRSSRGNGSNRGSASWSRPGVVDRAPARLQPGSVQRPQRIAPGNGAVSTPYGRSRPGPEGPQTSRTPRLAPPASQPRAGRPVERLFEGVRRGAVPRPAPRVDRPQSSGPRPGAPTSQPRQAPPRPPRQAEKTKPSHR